MTECDTPIADAAVLPVHSLLLSRRYKQTGGLLSGVVTSVTKYGEMSVARGRRSQSENGAHSEVIKIGLNYERPFCHLHCAESSHVLC